MKKNLVSLLAVAFVVAIIATGLFYGLVVAKVNNSPRVAERPIVVAARDLAPGTVLVPSDVKLAPRSGAGALVTGFSSEVEIAGLTVVEPIAMNEPVARELLVSEDSPRGAALGVPRGLRAVSIQVTDSTGVIGLLQPRHRVDAQVVYKGEGRSGPATTVRTVLQNLEVLKVDAQPASSAGRSALPVVTLLASPEEADVLGVADAAAQIRLLLRHPLDDEWTARSTVALESVMAAPAAARSSSRVSSSAGSVRTASRGGGR